MSNDWTVPVDPELEKIWDLLKENDFNLRGIPVEGSMSVSFLCDGNQEFFGHYYLRKILNRTGWTCSPLSDNSEEHEVEGTIFWLKYANIIRA